MGKQSIILSTVALLLLGVVPISASSSTDTAQLNSAKLHLRRATSDNIIVYVPCESQGLCSLQKLEYKTKLIHTSMIPSATSAPGDRVIHSLLPDTTYEILATVKFNRSSNGEDSVISRLTTRTCSEAIPKVSGLRVVKAGPGWIDVRWKPVEETTCYSDVFYLVNYYSTEWLQLGVFKDNDTLLFRPSHPCDAWPGEFCALLTDHVTPGGKHTIEIKTARYRWENKTAETSAGGAEKIIAVSNALLSGSYDFGAKDAHSPCAPPRRPPHPVGVLLNQAPIYVDQGQTRNAEAGIHLPLWGLVAAGLVLLGVLVFVIFAVYYRGKRRKRESTRSQIRIVTTNEFPHVSRLPMSQGHQTKNFDQNQPLPAPRVSNIYDSNIYDDCRDVPRATTIYEQLREPPMKPKATIPLNLIQGSGSSSNSPPPENFLPNDVYVPMGPPPPLYDDAQGVTQTPENVPVRQSENYVRPRQLPTYNEIMEADIAGPEYNRPYSTFTNGKWKAWN